MYRLAVYIIHSKNHSLESLKKEEGNHMKPLRPLMMRRSIMMGGYAGMSSCSLCWAHKYQMLQLDLDLASRCAFGPSSWLVKAPMISLEVVISCVFITLPFGTLVWIVDKEMHMGSVGNLSRMLYKLPVSHYFNKETWANRIRINSILGRSSKGITHSMCYQQSPGRRHWKE
jgi:hypothetical protein